MADADELMDGVGSRCQFRQSAGAEHYVGALAGLQAADHLTETGRARTAQGLHLDHVLRYHAVPGLGRKMERQETRIARGLWRAESVPSATDTPCCFISWIRVRCRIGVPHDM